MAEPAQKTAVAGTGGGSRPLSRLFSMGPGEADYFDSVQRESEAGAVEDALIGAESDTGRVLAARGRFFIDDVLKVAGCWYPEGPFEYPSRSRRKRWLVEAGIYPKWVTFERDESIGLDDVFPESTEAEDRTVEALRELSRPEYATASAANMGRRMERQSERQKRQQRREAMAEPARKQARAANGGGPRPPTGTSKRLPVAPTRDEIRAMLAACGGREALRNRTMIVVAFDAGCRVSELVRLRIQDLQPDGTLTFRRPKVGDEHAVTLQPDTVEAIAAYLLDRKKRERRTVLEPWGPIFTTMRGGRMTERTFRHVCQEAAEAAGIGKFLSDGDNPATLNRARPHGLRHSRGVAMTEDGADPLAIQSHLGHSDARMTDRYRRMASGWQREQAAKGTL